MFIIQHGSRGYQARNVRRGQPAAFSSVHGTGRKRPDPFLFLLLYGSALGDVTRKKFRGQAHQQLLFTNLPLNRVRAFAAATADIFVHIRRSSFADQTEHRSNHRNGLQFEMLIRPFEDRSRTHTEPSREFSCLGWNIGQHPRRRRSFIERPTKFELHLLRHIGHRGTADKLVVSLKYAHHLVL